MNATVGLSSVRKIRTGKTYIKKQANIGQAAYKGYVHDIQLFFLIFLILACIGTCSPIPTVTSA